MYLLKKEELTELLNNANGTCVTLYMPEQQNSSESRQDPIRLKNLLEKARKQMLSKGIEEATISSILKPGYDIADDSLFWNSEMYGLALFLNENFSKIIRVPQPLSEMVAVNERFHIKQLLPYFTYDKRFFVLTLSENRVSLIRCTKYICSELKIEGMETSLEKALDFISPEKGRDIPYKGTGRIKGKQEMLSGGKGGNEELKNERRIMFFRYINKFISKQLKNDVAPLVLATTDANFALYRDVCTYPHLIDKFIKGNPDELNLKNLHTKANAIIEPYFMKISEEAIQKYLNLSGTKSTVHNVHDALQAAYEGRVDTLIVAKEKEKWGVFDTGSSNITEHDHQFAGDHDLIDLAALYTLQNEGKVHVLEYEKMPKHMEVAGILRF